MTPIIVSYSQLVTSFTINEATFYTLLSNKESETWRLQISIINIPDLMFGFQKFSFEKNYQWEWGCKKKVQIKRGPHSMCKPHYGNLPRYAYRCGPHYRGSTYCAAMFQHLVIWALFIFYIFYLLLINFCHYSSLLLRFKFKDLWGKSGSVNK